VKEFAIFLSGDPSRQHCFTQANEKHIKLLNDCPSTYGLKNSTEMKKLKEVLVDVSVAKQLVRPKKWWIPIDQYRTDIGEPDPEDIGWEEVDGEMKEGVYKLKEGQRPNWFTVKEFNDKRETKRTHKADNKTELEDGQLDKQFQTSNAKFRKDHFRNTTSSIEGLLASARRSIPASAAKKARSSVGGDSDDEDDDSDGSEEPEKEDAVSVSSRESEACDQPGSSLTVAAPSSRPAPARNPGGGARGGATAGAGTRSVHRGGGGSGGGGGGGGRGGGGGGGGAGGPLSASASPPAAESKRRGRPPRVADVSEKKEKFCKEVQGEINQLEDEFEKDLSFGELCDETLPQELKQFKKLLTEKVTVLGKCLSRWTKLKSKVEAKEEEFQLQDTSNDIGKAHMLVESCIELAKLMQNPAPVPRIAELVDIMSSEGLELTYPYLKRKFKALVNKMVQFDDYPALARAVRTPGFDDPEETQPNMLQAIVGDSFSTADAVSYGMQVVEFTFNDLLKKLTTSDLQKKGVHSKRFARFVESFQLAEELIQSEALKPQFSLLWKVVSCASLPVGEVLEALDQIDETNDDDDRTLLKQVKTTTPGKMLTDFARADAEARSEEAQQDDRIMQAEVKVSEMPEGADGQIQSYTATSTKAWQEHVEPCASAAQALKALKDKSQKKRKLSVVQESRFQNLQCNYFLKVEKSVKAFTCSHISEALRKVKADELKDPISWNRFVNSMQTYCTFDDVFGLMLKWQMHQIGVQITRQ